MNPFSVLFRRFLRGLCFAALAGPLPSGTGAAQPVFFPFGGESRYTRQLDALNWVYAAGWEHQGAAEIRLNERFTSNLFLLNGEARNVQDENRFSLLASVPVAGRLRLRTDARQYAFSAGRVSQWAAAAGPEFRHRSGARLSAGAGLMSDRRNAVTDQGVFLNAAGRVPEFHYQALRLAPSLRAEYARLSPRSYAAARLETPVLYEAGPLRLDAFAFRTLDVRESYQAINFLNRNARDAVESIRTDTASLLVRATTALGPYWRVDAAADVRSISRTYTYRKLETADDRLFFDTGFRSRRADFRLDLGRTFSGWSARAGMSAGFSADEAGLTRTAGLPDDQVRRRREILENSIFYQNRLEARAAAGPLPGAARPWDLRVAASILRHDTPEANPDDRDEQQLTASGSFEAPLFPGFTAGTVAAAERIRYVFLFSERSAENNDRYSLRLLPFVRWAPASAVLISQQLLLRANYTVYRFPEATPGVTSQSAREYGHRTDASWRFLPGWSVNGSAQYNELRIGRLFWKSFRETPLDTLVTRDISVSASRYFRTGWITAGYRWFSKHDFLPLATSRIDRPDGTAASLRAPGELVTRQSGPTVDIRFPFEGRNELMIRGWYQRQSTRQHLYAGYPPEEAAAWRRSEKTAPDRYFPNLEILARIRL